MNNRSLKGVLAIVLAASAAVGLASERTDLPRLELSAAAIANDTDLDHDGLSDDVEQMLIDRHAPFLLFDHRNDQWPSGTVWFVQHSELVVLTGDPLMPLETIWNQPALEESPERAIASEFRSQHSNFLCTNEETAFHLNLLDQFRSGEDPRSFLAQGRFNVGMFAHAFRDPVNPDATIIIQYLQFFPYNDSQAPDACFFPFYICNIGDHEGDWLFLEVYVDNDQLSDYAVQKMVWHHHGDGNCPPSIAGDGGSFTLAEATLNGNGVTPKCYLEEDAHEWWPFSSAGGGVCVFFGIQFCIDVCYPFGCDYCIDLTINEEGHDGLSDFNYQAADIPNIGEIWTPMPGPAGTVPLENLLVLHFNGKWGFDRGDIAGDPPKGPILQGARSWWESDLVPTEPGLFLPTDTTIECDEPREPETTGFAVATHHCSGPPTVSFVDATLPGSCPSGQIVETIQRMWTVAWPSGDSLTDFQLITVEDTTVPQITGPPDVAVTCGAPTDPAVTGFGMASDNCDPDPVVEYQDDIVVTASPADAVMLRVRRTWSATDACGNASSTLQIITVLKVELPVDIRPHSCPNPLNRNSQGFLPVALLGSLKHNINMAQVATVLIARADGQAGTAGPNEGRPGPHSVFEDVGAAPQGAPCECYNLANDGILDLLMKFPTAEVVDALDLHEFTVGDRVELVVVGQLIDGCQFISRDCVTIVR